MLKLCLNSVRDKLLKPYAIRFVPKYRAFSILQNNIEDVVKKTTQKWKITYGLATIKEGKQEPVEVEDDEDNDDNEEGTTKGDIVVHIDGQTINEVEKQQE